MLVIDASVLASALGLDGPVGTRARDRLRGEVLAAPTLIDVEVLSVWRGLNRAGKLSDDRVDAAIADLADLPIRRVPTSGMLARCWELRHNVTAHDAAYVALAEFLHAPLLTSDRKLAGATGPRCTMEVLDGDS
ncbi:type II toxin-antitoxin system VapC family toxin [Kocuria sp.]|uniref:type II toxin-antitoxin system VapC family toxin n=1 Tax=Kocuria sp. TaxID=1871328 RepID=UPI0026DEDF87|nr:type II toxin-antitoxin system VapC family toxin [Kocuria sp.]MDO5617891.1 type II toxin-antitoxin system VapC family toxin [Kocuria sp.]